MLFLVVATGIAWYVSGLTKDLPDYDSLAQYEPPVMTRIHASDGQLVAEYARERRLYLPIQAIPDRVKAAFLSAEDKNFYHHPGVDYWAVARAVVQNVQDYGSGKRPVGASTITQQVAKNFLLTNERSIDRKIKEAFLSFQIESAYSKDKILELYLNQIYLGLGAYGVAAASLDYFDKSVHELTLAEAAYLAALPKAPNNYHPFRKTQDAIDRRNWVIDRMVENGFASFEEGEAAKATGLGVQQRVTKPSLFAADYFAEEVRRQLGEMFGEKSLYEGGLSVRTTLNPELQALARRSLMNGLIRFDRSRGWRGPVKRFDSLGEDWGATVFEVEPLYDVVEWQLAIVLESSGNGLKVGLRPDAKPGGGVGDARETGVVPPSLMKWAKRPRVGDVIYVSDAGEGQYELQQVPEIEGGMVAMDPQTGRVLALVGGFSFSDSEFNRATQAYRQPGSSFKPFVYSAALDNGYTPSSVVMDAPIEIDPGPGQEIWRPSNYSNEFYGPSTLRTGIERSRNVMTVRLAQDMGMPLVAEYSRRFGVYDDLPQYLPMSLGAGETTVLRMVAAYSVINNGGRSISPTLIDRIQNRFGDTVFKHDQRICEQCDAAQWAGQDEPEVIDNADQVLDPMTAYQMTSMLEGVVQRGTAARTVGAQFDQPLAGKTGTTNDYRDAWFVGFSPDLVVGVYVGYDQPRNLGRSSTGGQLAAPIFTEFMKEALADKPAIPFRVPPGMNFIPIDRKTGLQSNGTGAGVILEAFKPGTGPPNTYSIIGYTDAAGNPLTTVPAGASLEGGGGLY